MRQIIEKNEGIIAIAEFIRANDDFILICHIAPDGDTLGSALALYSVMKLFGKKVQVVCQDRVPQSLLFLPGAKEVICPDKAYSTDNVIVIDCGDTARLGKALGLFEKAKNTVSIDHHSTNPMFAMQNEVFPKCAATAEIMYELLRIYTGDSISREAANCLYTGLMTDTGAFAFSNTTADTFAVASELTRMGADITRINQLVYRTVPYRKVKLMGQALSSVGLYHGGKTGLCIMSQADFARIGAKSEDAEGIIDNIRDIESVEIAVFIRECLDGDYKASIRSKNYVDVARMSLDFGGGGHERAAGFKIGMPIEKLKDMVLSAAEAAYSLYEEE